MEEGRRTNVAEMILHPPIAFLRNYVLRAGFRDGTPGLLVSALNSYYVFMKLVKLWEMQHRVSLHDDSPLAHRRAKFERAPNKHPVPGSLVPGSSVPGSSVPGSSVPGSSVPGSSVPGSSVPGQPTARDEPRAAEEPRTAAPK
jgi:hypothetical protein